MALNGRKCKQRDECVAACINTLMDRDDCPHFFDGKNSGDQAWALLRLWLTDHGKQLMIFPYKEDPRPIMLAVVNDGYYMLLCHNGHGEHAVICQGDERVFDPGWIQSPIEGAMDNGYWMVGVLV